ncbi:conserved unknown protein [Ectocarpus siliculosus]|uniref:Uncharacterized protein n=1 Tax=Ectocarpus siliculosus TaxID=2880 RepID=D7G4N4_ECTSI|nr:conserved unknown protein [Ectocarpus siliculosus]|eukprot:CBJ33721.1 conserved unknown protein [Ectocarpus siliculosus]
MVSGDSARKGKRHRAPAPAPAGAFPEVAAAGAASNDAEVNSSSRKNKKKRKREQRQALEDEGERQVDAAAEPQRAAVDAKRSKKKRREQQQHQPLICTSKVAEYSAGTSDDKGTAGTPVKRETKSKKKKRRDKGSLRHDQDHVPPSADEETSPDNDNESPVLEGIVHDGAMYLVDARRRVFSAQRDEQGGLVEVGTFDDKGGKVIMIEEEGSPPSDSPANNNASLAGAAAAAEAGLISSPPSALHRDPATKTDATEAGNGKAKKKKKRKKKKGTAAGSSEDVAASVGAEAESVVVEYPFEVEECDHCETSERAYSDISPLLSALAAELGKPPEDLVIYDPYYCQGSTVGRLASLGFPRVHNRKEDFYEVVKNGNIPQHDVVVTNPPFSGEHMPKILKFCARQGAKPWFLLLPNYVYLKDYYEPSLGRRSGQGATRPFYLTPPKRYMYYSPQGSRLKVKSSERKTSPFNTFWYIHLGDCAVTSKILQSYDAASRKLDINARCCVARTTQQIPYKMMDSNDPRRKKARDRQRSIDRIRKKKNEWIV